MVRAQGAADHFRHGSAVRHIWGTETRRCALAGRHSFGGGRRRCPSGCFVGFKKQSRGLWTVWATAPPRGAERPRGAVVQALWAAGPHTAIVAAGRPQRGTVHRPPQVGSIRARRARREET